MTTLKTTKTLKTGLAYRSFQIRADEISEDRTVELAFSSEEPIETSTREVGRFVEILDHGEDSVDMTRLRAGAQLLVEHDPNDVVGVVESATIGPDRVGRAMVRFGMSARAEEIFQDVKTKIRRLVSVGYRVREWVTEKVEERGLKTLRAVRWSPAEISIVSVPADLSVGINRSEKREEYETTLTENTPEPDMKIRALLDPNPADGGGGASVPPTPKADANLAATATQKRNEDILEIRSIAKQHRVPEEMFDKALERGIDSHAFRAEVLTYLGGRPQPETTFRETTRTESNSIGERIIAHPDYKKAIASRNKSFGFDLPGLGLSTRATLTASGESLTGYDRPPGIVTLGQQPLSIAQLFAQGETSSPTVRYMKEDAYAQGATAVAEEGAKPEATFDLSEVDAAVRKIAVIGRVTDEILSDFPAVRDYVNQRLVFMVGALEDNHLLNGTGANNQITGVLQTSGINTQAAGAVATVVDAIYHAMTKVSSVGFFTPDAIVCHPNDWRDIRLSKDGNGQYYGGGPFSGTYGVGPYTAAGNLWGLPVVATTAIAEGTALVGAFRLGAQLFRREGIRVEMTNSDHEDFKYNRIAIRVEERLALAVYRPLAFCSVTGIA